MLSGILHSDRGDEDPDGETPEPVAPAPQFTPATAEQLHKINEFVDAYAEMCENVKTVDIMNRLKENVQFFRYI